MASKMTEADYFNLVKKKKYSKHNFERLMKMVDDAVQ